MDMFPARYKICFMPDTTFLFFINCLVYCIKYFSLWLALWENVCIVPSHHNLHFGVSNPVRISVPYLGCVFLLFVLLMVMFILFCIFMHDAILDMRFIHILCFLWYWVLSNFPRVLCWYLLSIFSWDFHWSFSHYCDVIKSATASQITGPTSVYSTICSSADQTNHQSFASLAFVRGINWRPVNSPHKGLVTQKMFPFYDIIMKLDEDHSCLNASGEFDHGGCISNMCTIAR